MTATHLRLDALLFGVTLRAVMEYHPERFASARRWRVPLALAGVACWLPNLVVEPTSVWTRTVGLSLTLLGAAALLVAVFASSTDDLGRARPVLEPPIRFLAWVGVFSYAIYLWHIAATGAFESLTERAVTPWAGDGQLGWVISAAVVCAGILAVGIIVSIVVERPVLRIRERVAPSRAAALPAGAPAPVPEPPPDPPAADVSSRLAPGTAPTAPETA
jgi:peptidoglycan/LPS O-acetylase OafA/YrhL